MKEPNYRLNKKDAARFHALLVRHCLEAPDADGKVVRHPNYPPLSLKENAELNQLTRKRSIKIASNPKVRRADYLLRKLKRSAERLSGGGI